MRKTITISLPEELAKKLAVEIKRRNFATTSEFIRRLINKWFIEQEERKYLLKKRSNQILKDVIKRAEIKDLLEE